MQDHDVVVAATGIVPFSKKTDLSVDLLAAAAVLEMLSRSGFDGSLIQEAYVGSAKGGGLIGQRSLRFAGLASGLPVFNIENACASSATAFHVAYRAVGSGAIDCALVMGVDKLSVLGKGTLPVQETEWDGQNGVTNPVVYAMRATRYLHEAGAGPEDLAAVTVKSRRFGAMNPIAHFRRETSIEEVLASRMIAEPLTMYQCSPKSDGAAALVLVSGALARQRSLRGPVVRASVVKSGRFSMAERDIVRPDITLRASKEAYERSGLGPGDLDVVELHDAFSIAELLYYEELGLCAEGDGVGYLRSGASSAQEAGGPPIVNASGGLLSRGHPIGATGVAQIIECTEQLMGVSGVRQREHARAALAHVTGGGASGFDNGACAVTILTAD